MKSLPSFIIAILLLGLCVIEKKSKERALQLSNFKSEVGSLIESRKTVNKVDSVKLETLDLKRSFLLNFVSTRF